MMGRLLVLLALLCAVPAFAHKPSDSYLTVQASESRLLVRWDTVENHTVDFQMSADFAEWRKLVAHCFAVLPTVEHTRSAVTLDIGRAAGSS